MLATANHLLETIAAALPELQAIPDGLAATAPAPGKWSPKQIIGHLIDSAANNHQKFLRTMAEDRISFPGYDQDRWVAAQHYDQSPWLELLRFWEYYNRHLAQVIRTVPEAALSHTVHIDGKGPFTLEFMMKDYVEHLKHHLKAILPEAGYLDNSFRMVY